MGEAAPAVPSQLRLRFEVSEAEFKARFAEAAACDGLFVPAAALAPVSALVPFRLDLQGGVFVSGIAKVDEHVDTVQRTGTLLRITALDRDSVQFPLMAPAEALAGAVAAGGDADERKAASQLAQALDELDIDIDEASSVAESASEPTGRRSGARTSLERRNARERAERRPVETSIPGVSLEPSGPSAGGSSKWVDGFKPGDVLGTYQLLKRLGSGGMAEVYLARSAFGFGVEKLVALKMVRPAFGPETEFGSLFLNEAKISVTLQHPNIIQVFGFGEAAGRPYLAMEYLHGRTVSSLIKRMRAQRCAPRLAFGVTIAIELCKALEYLHQKRDLDGEPLNLIHRDISAGNVFVSERGEVKLLDFGVATASAGETAGLVVGKRCYMSPEQARGINPQPSWDVYSLGVLLYEMLTLEELSPDGPAMHARQRASSINPNVPPKLDRAVLWATDPNASRRPASAAPLRALLEEVHAKLPRYDLAQVMRSLFGEDLARDQREIEKFVVSSRHLLPASISGAWPKVGNAKSGFHRRLESSRIVRRLRRRPWLARVGAVLLLAAIGGGVWAGVRHFARQRDMLEHIQLADDRLAAARLVGPSGDAALDHLLAARRLAPSDPRVLSRLASLATTFEGLAKVAERRGDYAEAAIHYQAALEADPARVELQEHVRALEKLVRTQSGNKKRP